jgi:hypothetical protein
MGLVAWASSLYAQAERSVRAAAVEGERTSRQCKDGVQEGRQGRSAPCRSVETLYPREDESRGVCGVKSSAETAGFAT